ncbi:MAG: hypothetical protein AB1772_12925 [Candidatus Zixiibacteriota bacterium]
MKRLISAATCILFTLASITDGYAVVFCLPAPCGIAETVTCSSPAPEQFATCFGAAGDCAAMPPQPLPESPRLVLPLFLAMHAEMAPCPPDVCCAMLLTELWKEQPQPKPSLDNITAIQAVELTRDYESRTDTHASRPAGVHVIISTTCLRC